jgi:hypothetical protein
MLRSWQTLLQQPYPVAQLGGPHVRETPQLMRLPQLSLAGHAIMGVQLSVVMLVSPTLVSLAALSLGGALSLPALSIDVTSNEGASDGPSRTILSRETSAGPVSPGPLSFPVQGPQSSVFPQPSPVGPQSSGWQVAGMQPQTLGAPPPPHVWLGGHPPQRSTSPQPSETAPQCPGHAWAMSIGIHDAVPHWFVPPPPQFGAVSGHLPQ